MQIEERRRELFATIPQVIVFERFNWILRARQDPGPLS